MSTKMSKLEIEAAAVVQSIVDNMSAIDITNTPQSFFINFGNNPRIGAKTLPMRPQVKRLIRRFQSFLDEKSWTQVASQVDSTLGITAWKYAGENDLRFAIPILSMSAGILSVKLFVHATEKKCSGSFADFAAEVFKQIERSAEDRRTVPFCRDSAAYLKAARKLDQNYPNPITVDMYA